MCKSESTMEQGTVINNAGNHSGESNSCVPEMNVLADNGSAPEIVVAEEESGLEARALWRNYSNLELDNERRSSLSSSGYAGERGSSGASSASADTDEDEIREDNQSQNGVSDSQAAWVLGKRHVDEDDASVSWRKRKKHFFILSHSGKPIYSRGDCVKLVRAGKHQVVFLVKGPIYLVCISCTEEPYESLRGQLELIYGQVALNPTLPSIPDCFFPLPLGKPKSSEHHQHHINVQQQPHSNPNGFQQMLRNQSFFAARTTPRSPSPDAPYLATYEDDH